MPLFTPIPPFCLCLPVGTTFFCTSIMSHFKTMYNKTCYRFYSTIMINSGPAMVPVRMTVTRRTRSPNPLPPYSAWTPEPIPLH
ncbi:hypothetical protein BGW80DRAFT_1325595 [Lactifluus volemus]|nr:hypothetical protein BGW80DRAFT_1325595 [Lactifluus volemus]